MPDVKSDLEIARAATMKPITDIAETLGVPADRVRAYGPTKAKIDTTYLDGTGSTSKGKLILVITASSASNPAPAAGLRQSARGS